MNTELLDLSGEPGRFSAKIKQEPRFVDLSKCTSCGECEKVCPITVPNEYDIGLSNRKAIFKKYAQAIPGAYAISKRGTAPCKATCPAHVSIQGYVALINEGKYREGLALFKEEHPFPGVCGRICHHPCEGECTRNDLDQPLGIQPLHRFLADVDMASEDPYVPEVKEKREETVAIIGSGPAGLTAAYELVREGYGVTVFEKLPVAGGMMAVGIPEYRLPRDVLNAEIGMIEKMGVAIKTDTAFGSDITLDSLKKDGFKAVYLATGLHSSRKLGVEGEDLENVLPGVPFLRDSALGKDITMGKHVVVIGGGNVAVDVSLTAKRLGAETVKMICLEARHEMPAWDYEIEEAVEENVEIINSLGPKQFIGENGKLSNVEFKKCTSVFDENNRFNPQYDENDITSIDADLVIVAIGQMAELEFAQSENIKTTPPGGLAADPVTFQTSIDWVFAGGDAVYGPKSVVEAVACGKEAAESIHRFINGLDLTEDREQHWTFEKPDIEGEEEKDRVPIQKISVPEREHNFKEVAMGFEEAQALAEAARCLKCGICSECYQCVDACIAKAINHDDQELIKEIDVGSIVLCPGNETYDPSVLEDQYKYNSSLNVVTSAEFERILSASGPTLGHLVRPSDEKEPKKIAWLQCIGSRDTNRCGNEYCSSVCCMYAIKESMIAKEHSEEELDCVVFNMDIRTFGKDYEKYYNRAKDEEGVRFVKARVHTIDEDKETGNLTLRYADESGELVTEEFDMVVLSVGLQISEPTIELANRLNIKLNRHKFAETPLFEPVSTSRKGVYACGVFQGPKDIPTSVIEASAAAMFAGKGLADARNTLTKTVEIPDEIDVAGQEARIGVFVCKCGINIAGVVNMDEVEEYTKSLPHVVFVGQNLFTCSQDTQDQIKALIAEHNLNRVVVASCTPKTHEGIFMDTIESCGINKYLFEMANIRNQNSWIHSDAPEKATEKAKDLIRMAVARSSTLYPLHEKIIPVNKRATVVGGGVAGMNAALGLAEQGFETILIEKEKELGGTARRLTQTIEGTDIQPYLDGLIQKTMDHSKIQVLTQSLIVGFSGFKGNFQTEVLVGPGMYERKIDHGAAIMATGANEYQPKEFLYGEDKRVMTQIELANYLNNPDITKPDQVVMIQCVGSRNKENPNCSRICCQSAIKNALHIKDINPDADIFILYRDIRMYGFLEEYYTEARKKGIMFFRYDPDEMPEVKAAEDGVEVIFKDHILGKKLSVTADLLALSAGMTPEDTEELATIMKLARNEEGFFMEAHVKLRPVDMATEGVFVCGTAHSPRLITEAISQAYAAASRAVTFLSQDQITLSAVTARVNQEKCASCLICVRSCAYGVPRINEDGVSEIDEALCRGCGVCAAECPAKAIELNWYEDDQIMCKVDSLLEGVL